DAIAEIIQATGFEEISLLSLSSSDYAYVHELVDAVHDKYAGSGLSLGLPSLRIESTSADLLDKLGDTRRHGFTFAPEAATEHMRNMINKSVPDEQVLQTARDVYSRGWRTIKFYFMIGHPNETLEDVQAIVNLCKAVLREGRKLLGYKATVNVGVSTFIPKPHTPFQWVPQDSHEQVNAKLQLLKSQLREDGLHLRWNAFEDSDFEGWMSRGDRRLGEVIERAWRMGCRFDAWMDKHNHPAWLQAFADEGLDSSFYTTRERDVTEIFAWDHIDAAVHKKF
ncbi:MAG TPA: radical SAM protein, partial [Aggregatilineales bacterium]|nr:radical SAM protein [Aggregatilineales bacterium]